ncbi:MAG: hypothetical protein PWP65_575 [Clostridia bacterium]|nr:hypothetical protein [Clostridia bacterium]
MGLEVNYTKNEVIGKFMFNKKVMATFAGGLMALFCLVGAMPAAEAVVISDLRQVAAVVSHEDYQMLAGRINTFTRLYRIEEGDTIARIARRFQVDADLVAAMNYLDQDANLYPGQFLILPVAESEGYRVMPGDTVWDIARRYGTTVERILAFNNIGDPRKLQVGTVLTIPGNAAGMRAAGESIIPASSRGGLLSFIWPLLGAVTSGFGWRGAEFHHGLDIAGEKGDQILAACSGRVSFAGWRNGIYGWTVVLDHGNGLKTLYAHNSRNLVTAGDYVRAGDPIALVGDSGRTTGPHLHFEVLRNGRALNPLRFLN